jgi:hypothetical protein
LVAQLGQAGLPGAIDDLHLLAELLDPFTRQVAEHGRYPSPPMTLRSASTPFSASALSVCPGRKSGESRPHSTRNRIRGLAVTLTMIFSRPRLAVCTPPAMATAGSAAAGRISCRSVRVQTATGAAGSPST